MALKIAIDYDDTWTAAPELFSIFVQMAAALGHEVFLVTSRPGHGMEKIDSNKLPSHLRSRVFYAAGTAKRTFMQRYGIEIDIWIDDKPDYIVRNYGLEFLR